MGEVCKTIFPIPENVFLGNKESSIAICTLSSMKLLNEVSNSDIMKKIAIAGRLLSENKGIDSLVKSIISNNSIKLLILCGKEVVGHKPGHSLLCLHKYGISEEGRINNSESKNPFLELSPQDTTKFQKQIKLINEIGVEDLEKIKKIVDSLIHQ